MSRNILPFLCPWLNRTVRSFKPEHVKAYISLQKRYTGSVAYQNFTGHRDVEKQKRLDQLSKVKPLEDYHPRLVSSVDTKRLSLRDFVTKFTDITERMDEFISVFGTSSSAKAVVEKLITSGRVRSVRLSGSKLIFLDIERDTIRLQIMVDAKKLTDQSESENLNSFKKVVKVGDWVSVEGNPTRTAKGQLSVLALKIPQLLALCLHHLPEKVDDAETLARKPHVHQLTNNEPRSILQLRALVYNYLRKYFSQHNFIEVETPMFDVNAGGAIARPFETVANELSNMPIKLRIAPELNLKRLIIGGQDKVYELGRVFRNEGIDTTHNPEFSTCEFYEVGATLPSLVERTETLISGLHTMIEECRSRNFPLLCSPSGIDFSTPFAKLPFIPTIEKAIGCELPNLSEPSARSDLLEMFKNLDIAIPPDPALPRLLDALAEKYIEPLCQSPTFITEHPEALSPLSKSFIDLASGQRVAARVELFINGREYINAYEEENSPFEQRRKFIQQLEFHPDGEGTIDESYLEALEWGMPPTGGWGCGLDRLIMLFASKRRIADVLPFGTLRNVVSIAKNK